MEGYHGYPTPQTKVYSAGGGLFGSGGILGTGLKPQNILGSANQLFSPDTGANPNARPAPQEEDGPDTTTVIVLVFVGLLVLGGTGFLTYKLAN